MKKELMEGIKKELKLVTKVIVSTAECKREDGTIETHTVTEYYE